MALTVRLKKDEVGLIRDALGVLQSEKTGTRYWSKVEKISSELLVKLAALEEFGPLKKKSTGLPVRTAIEAFREVLGPRLVLPPNPDATWWAIQSRALTSGGFTREHCLGIARVAGRKWQGLIKIESLLRQATVLLAEEVEGAVSEMIERLHGPTAMEKV